MPNIVIAGAQWGDEGKGKVVDLLTRRVQVVARYNGGHNAGHTVIIGDKKFILHVIPSGILHPGILCVLGNGMVVNPAAFEKERSDLEALGIDCTSSCRTTTLSRACRRSSGAAAPWERPCAARGRRTRTRRAGAG
jgi:adenylosuccinate synthase